MRTIPPMPSIKEMLRTADGKVTCLVIAASIVSGVVGGILRLRVGEFPIVRLLALAPIVYAVHAVSAPYLSSKRQHRTTALLIAVATPLIAYELLL